MAQKNKVTAKGRTSKPASTAGKTVRTAAAKPKAQQPKHAVKTSVTKAVLTKQVAKGPEMKKSAVSGKKASAKPVAAVKPVAVKIDAVVAKAPVVAAKAAPVAAKAPAKVAQPAQKPVAALPKVAAAPQAQPISNATQQIRAAAALAKAPGQKITAPVVQAPQPMLTPKALAEKAAQQRQAAAAQAAAAAAAQANKKPVSQRHGFKTNEFIVYPAHGVGRIVGIEEQEIAGISLELFVITFDKEKLTLRVPTGKLESVGMRKLAEDVVVKKAIETLKGRARVKRTMWSRRAQEYVAKINSGDLVSIAEVVRDLYRSEAQPEQSYSERQLYEDALDRMAREIAAVEKLDDRGAVQRITEVLSKSAKGRRMAEGAEESSDEIKAA